MSAGLSALLGLGLVLAFASAAISAIETAMFSMNQERRRKLRARDARRAAKFEVLMAKPDEVADTLLLANTLANVPLVVLILWIGQSVGYWEDVPGWLLVGMALVVIVVFCELLPKLVAFAAPIRTTRLSLPFVTSLVPLLSPITTALQRACDPIVGWLFRRSKAPRPQLSEEEMETLVEIGREEGTFDETESRLLREVMKLRDESARHCMTPRVDIFTLPDDLTNDEAAQRVRRKRHRFVPVRGETPDDIVGLLDVREFLLNPTATHYTERLRPPSFVPETMKALDLLRSFTHHRQHLAILLDEYGGIEGIVTLSDLVEQLLGEEGPDQRNELYIERIGEERVLAAGGTRLDDLAEEIGIEAGDKDVETIGGLVVEHFGSVPKVGESFVHDGWRITVRRATSKRVKEVLIEPAEEAAQ
ncbi:MAG: hemolysin family protein [Chthoniobacterales bacterium]